MIRRHALVSLLSLFAFGLTALAKDQPRDRRSLDFDWKFKLDAPTNAIAVDFDDRQWRTLNVPHDWSIEGPFREGSEAGKAGGFAPLGVGWYRRIFHLPGNYSGKRVTVEFDGVFAETEVWFNGQKVGHNDFGYLGFRCDLTRYVNLDGANVLTVRADNSRQASRWYTGSGIYRHVWLEATDPLHVAHGGTFATTSSVTEKAATVNLKTIIKNESALQRPCILATRILNDAGAVAATAESRTNVPAGVEVEVTQNFTITHPHLWSLENPHLYHATSEIRDGKRIVDVYETPFGIRTIKFDPDTGFSLNGTKVVLKGVCLHHDNGAFGAASIDRAIERRLEILKEMGCNAVRLSHNPHAPEMLNLCDRMGILVVDEAFDKWSGFTPDGKGWRDNLQNFIARDRNHPSVILWSAGNEVKEQLKPEGTALLKKMVEFVHRIDPSRPVTCALHPGRLPGLELSEMAHAMDVVSMNYQPQLYDDDHRTHPKLVILGSETLPFYTYNERRSGDADKFLPGNSWFAVKDYVAGQFIWAGIDYLGESTGWPSKGWPLGLVDTCGFRKDFSYYQQSLYSTQPMVRIVVYDPNGGDVPGKRGWGWPNMSSHWNWPATNKTLKIATFANCSRVELVLNGKSFGEKKLQDFSDRIITWQVPNQPGTIRAIGKENDKVVCSHELKTAGKPARIVLLPDRKRIRADGRDLSHVEVNLVDDQGVLVPDAELPVTFAANGPGGIIAVDNGDLNSAELYQASRRTTNRGKCLAILQSTSEAGQIRLTATSAGLLPATVMIETLAQ